MAGESELSNKACLWRHLSDVDMLHVGAVCIIDLEVALMEPVDEVLLGRLCECLSHDMDSIGGDEGIVEVGGGWLVWGRVCWRCIR